MFGRCCSHTAGTQDTRSFWDDHCLNAQPIGDGARMLWAGPAKGDERVVGGIIAVADGNAPNSFRHVLDRDLQQSEQQCLFALGSGQACNAHLRNQFT